MKLIVRYFIFGVLLFTISAVSASGPPNASPVPSVSWSSLNVVVLNKKIEQAVADAKVWPQSPLQTVINLVGGESDARTLSIKKMKNRNENADSVQLIYIRDGLLDDAIRGDWHQFTLQKQQDRSWRVVIARAAYRCWRSERTNHYQESPC